MKLRYLFIQLKVQDGEREHNHRVLHTTTAKNLDFAAERYVASYWGESELDKSCGAWFAHGGEIAIQLEKCTEITESEYQFLNKLFYGA
jgi:hypothetical protein